MERVALRDQQPDSGRNLRRRDFLKRYNGSLDGYIGTRSHVLPQGDRNTVPKRLQRREAEGFKFARAEKYIQIIIECLAAGCVPHRA